MAELKGGIVRGGADALVYLLAGRGDRPGMAVVLGPDIGTRVRALPLLSGAASGPLEAYLDAAAERQHTGSAAALRAWEDALVELCDWATGAAVVPVLTGVAERLAASGNRRRGRPGPDRPGALRPPRHRPVARGALPHRVGHPVRLRGRGDQLCGVGPPVHRRGAARPEGPRPTRCSWRTPV